MSPFRTDDLSQLGKKALWYAASAGAVLGLSTSDVDAQIVYVDIDPDLDVMDTFSIPGEFEGIGVDFDGDVDAEIVFAEVTGQTWTMSRLWPLNDGPDRILGIVGTTTHIVGQRYAFFVPVTSGVPIGPGNATVETRTATFTYSGVDRNGFGNGDNFIGVQFSFDGASTHFAWLRVQIPTGGGRILVKDFAYESSPDTPINAGDMAGTVAIEPGLDGLPGTHNLSNVYPNPFNPQARFTLEVAEQQDVRISVYDALGREVATLHEGTLGAGTIHEFQIDGANLPSGVYVVRAIGEQFTDVRQVTLAK